MIQKKFLHLTQGLITSGCLVCATAGASDPGTVVVDDLLTSSNLTSAWQACSTDSLAIDVTNLDAGGCAYRTTPVVAGVTYKMSCGISVSKYASITLSYLDADDVTLDSDTTEVFEHTSGVYSVALQAPVNAVTAAIGIYGESGSGFQDCVLIDDEPVTLPTKGSISGTTWFDESEDSVFDSNESVITSTPVTLLFEGQNLDQTITNADGAYTFSNLDVAACYNVSFGVADSTVELGAVGADNSATITGATDEICLTDADNDVVEIDAAFVAIAPTVPPADYAICGYAWLDTDTNGYANGNDTLMDNVIVQMNAVGSDAIHITETENGKYAFSNLKSGDYNLQFLIPDGHEATTQHSQPQAGRSYIDDSGVIATISLPEDGNTADNAACTVEQVNAGFVELPIALEPTVAKDDNASSVIGIDFTVDVLANDSACDGVHAVDLLGHNVPGEVSYNVDDGLFYISNTTKTGTYSIEYGLRGNCGSYDTALVEVFIESAPVIQPIDAPAAPICRVETNGSTTIGGVDVFNSSATGFASNYNMYDRDKNLVITVSSDDYTHKRLLGNNENQWESPWANNWEIEWGGTKFGYDQVSIYYVSAVENDIESAMTECVRSAVSPIALDLENKGRIQTLAGSFEVDMNDDGYNEALSQWFAPSAGILINKNASGKVSGKDMFGNIPGVYADGFAELATLDVNDDGQLTNKELNTLAIWTDLNSDTMIDQSELSSLDDHKIISLAVHHYKFMARAKISNGKSILMEDVWLPRAPMAALTK